MALGRCLLHRRRCLGRLPFLPRLPLRECGLITVERFVVEIEYTRIAAAVTAIVEIGLHGRRRLRVVTECGSRHGKSRSVGEKALSIS